MATPPPKLYLLSCATGPLESFRLAELASVANLFNVDYSFPHGTPDESRPYMIVQLAGDREARLLASRLVSVKHIWELWTYGDTYEQVHERCKTDACREFWEPYASDRSCTWKFTVAGHNRTIPLAIQVKTINSFSYMAFLGDIDLRNPNLEVGVFEEYVFDGTRGQKMNEAREKLGVNNDAKGKKKERDQDLWNGEDAEFRGVWIGRKVRRTVRFSPTQRFRSS
ncbi:hypothetical protein JCM10212_002198 [Sporobolomyces blumeae]